MCGRTAQSVQTVRAAAVSFGIPENSIAHENDHGDNYNLSPGMDAWVFHNTSGDGTTLQVSRKVWGLVTRPGTTGQPLEENDMGRHFQNLMFNARSDDGHLQPTFARLAGARKTCVVAVDGFFEWKTETGAKQPYFVSCKQNSYTLLAGLWTSVSTGRPDRSRLDTFTILTTAAAPSLRWLHSRMPVRLPTVEAANQWLSTASVPPTDTITPWKWHKVAPAMTSLKFRSEKAIAPLPPTKTIDSMFRSFAKKVESASPQKEPAKAALSKSAESTSVLPQSKKNDGNSATPEKLSRLPAPPQPKKRATEKALTRDSSKSTPSRKKTKAASKVAGTPTIDTFFQRKS